MKFRGYKISELIICAEREATRRRRVYPNRVLTGRMSRLEAERQIEMMEAISEHLCEVMETERLL